MLTFSDLLLLEIDSRKLPETSVVKVEDTVGGGELFPHVYGIIPLDAITGVEEIEQ